MPGVQMRPGRDMQLSIVEWAGEVGYRVILWTVEPTDLGAAVERVATVVRPGGRSDCVTRTHQQRWVEDLPTAVWIAGEMLGEYRRRVAPETSGTSLSPKRLTELRAARTFVLDPDGPTDVGITRAEFDALLDAAGAPSQE